ncbi:multisubunit Na+/H+ antiporter MnhG subunit [Micrococcus cohnii]|uniref:Multisubunit Na+/H+ antiporter MnhG subunit n=1 Tax=Micrococcus cohnii TaxID=993416 RepID=A0A7W7GPA9_9MICC|nr:PLDc N-terminal domain-containing protein [Micrococcus cohnii]MBB4735808.1 multisubunit Na+/H+ antiporter MnhG subunit [Micrococcus cohnii]
MVRFLVPAAIVLVALTLYALFESLLTPAHRVRALPKWAWVLVVLVVPLVGPLLWLTLGRAQRHVDRPGTRSSAPDDDEEFLRGLREQRRRERREDGPADGTER